MAQFRVLERSFINNKICEAGEIVDYDGDPSDNLEAVDDKSKGKKAKGDEAPAEPESEPQLA